MASAATVVMRFANNIIGGEQFVDLEHWLCMAAPAAAMVRDHVAAAEGAPLVAAQQQQGKKARA